MAANSLNLNFNLRDLNATKETPVNLIIRYSNQKFSYPTGEKINPRHWQGDKSKRNYQRAKPNGGFIEYTEFNSRLDNIENTVQDIFRRYKNDNGSAAPTWNKFKELLDLAFRRKEPMAKDFMSFIKQEIEVSKSRTNTKTGRIISAPTIRKYNTTYNHLEDFISKTGKRLDFEDINATFYNQFVSFLQTQYNLATNSIGKDISVIKKFLNDATEKGINKNNAYKSNNFAVISEKSDSIYLSEDELKLLFELDLSSSYLEKTRDLFLIGCYTGLRYSDFSVLDGNHIKNGAIEIETYKTGETVIIPLHPIVESIFKKYNYKLPKSISNQKTNDYIKEVGKLVPQLNTDITKRITRGGKRTSTDYKKWQLITTHTARRSFATNLYLGGFPAIEIMKITGHRTESAFMRYIKITPADTAKRLQAHWDRQKSSPN
jgi:integrase